MQQAIKQILLNYHHPDRLTQSISLTDVLNNQVDPKLFKDTIVIISTTANSLNSVFYRPYSAELKQPITIPALLIHAQIVSQLLSTVLDGRSPIRYWAE
ncbi:MAG: CHASE2 domain-containing protein [Richelia sp.]|nr:CHASE2 domain-containing protein [Richelia sp.]